MIDARIPLGAQLPQINNPLDVQQKALETRRMQMQNDSLEREEQERRSIGDIMKRGTKVGPDGRVSFDRSSLQEIVQVNPEKAMAAQKQVDAMDDETMERVTRQAKRLAFGATPENYPQIRSEAIRLNLPNAESLPEFYSPQFVEQWQLGTLKGEEILAERWRQREFGLKQRELGVKEAEAGGKKAAAAAQAAADLRKERSGLPVTKATTEVSSAFNKIQSAAKDPSAAGDMSLIFGYMKMLDPGSTVREGEFANAQNAGGVGDRVAGLYNQVLNGMRLSAEQRADFLNQAKGVYDSQTKIQSQVDSQYTALAKKAGVDPQDVLLNFAADGDLDSLNDGDIIKLYDALPKGGK